MRYLLIGDPGLEEVTADEACELHPGAVVLPRPHGTPGRTRIELDVQVDPTALATVHHVVELYGEAEVDTLDEIRRAVADVELPSLAEAESFRVSSTLGGHHAFERRELEGAAGAVIQRKYGTRVDLERHQVNVRVDLHERHLAVGVQRTRTDLDKRILRARVLRTSLKPTIAAAMVRLAGAHRGRGRLIDPLCGTGTIPIEALRANPSLEVSACDWDDETVEIARATIANHALEIELRVADARTLAACYEEPFDFIVSDPPYGVRLGKRSSIRALYADLLASFERRLAPGGRIVLVVLKFRAFLAALEPTSLRIVDERRIEFSGLRPRILVLDRP